MNPQVDILVGFGCNARCGFCVQEATRKTPFSPGWTESLEKAITYVHSKGVRRAVITGGEPTTAQHASRSLEALQTLRGFDDWQFVAIYTNGSGLLAEVSGKPFAEVASEFGLTDVNLSCHHYDDMTNNDIFDLDNRQPVEEIVSRCQSYGLQVRLDCNLMKSGIENLESILRYLEWARSLRIKDVYFRDLFHFRGSTYYDPSREDGRGVVAFCESHRIDFQRLLGNIHRSPDFSFLGCRIKNEGYGREVAFLYKQTPVYFADLVIGEERPGERTYWVVLPNGCLYDAFTSEAHRIELYEASR